MGESILLYGDRTVAQKYIPFGRSILFQMRNLGVTANRVVVTYDARLIVTRTGTFEAIQIEGLGGPDIGVFLVHVADQFNEDGFGGNDREVLTTVGGTDEIAWFLDSAILRRAGNQDWFNADKSYRLSWWGHDNRYFPWALPFEPEIGSYFPKEQRYMPYNQNTAATNHHQAQKRVPADFADNPPNPSIEVGLWEPTLYFNGAPVTPDLPLGDVVGGAVLDMDAGIGYVCVTVSGSTEPGDSDPADDIVYRLYTMHSGTAGWLLLDEWNIGSVGDQRFQYYPWCFNPDGTKGIAKMNFINDGGKFGYFKVDVTNSGTVVAGTFDQTEYLTYVVDDYEQSTGTLLKTNSTTVTLPYLVNDVNTGVEGSKIYRNFRFDYGSQPEYIPYTRTTYEYNYHYNENFPGTFPDTAQEWEYFEETIYRVAVDFDFEGNEIFAYYRHRNYLNAVGLAGGRETLNDESWSIDGSIPAPVSPELNIPIVETDDTDNPYYDELINPVTSPTFFNNPGLSSNWIYRATPWIAADGSSYASSGPVPSRNGDGNGYLYEELLMYHIAFGQPDTGYFTGNTNSIGFQRRAPFQWEFWIEDGMANKTVVASVDTRSYRRWDWTRAGVTGLDPFIGWVYSSGQFTYDRKPQIILNEVLWMDLRSKKPAVLVEVIETPRHIMDLKDVYPSQIANPENVFVWGADADWQCTDNYLQSENGYSSRVATAMLGATVDSNWENEYDGDSPGTFGQFTYRLQNSDPEWTDDFNTNRTNFDYPDRPRRSWTLYVGGERVWTRYKQYSAETGLQTVTWAQDPINGIFPPGYSSITAKYNQNQEDWGMGYLDGNSGNSGDGWHWLGWNIGGGIPTNEAEVDDELNYNESSDPLPIVGEQFPSTGRMVSGAVSLEGKWVLSADFTDTITINSQIYNIVINEFSEGDIADIVSTKYPTLDVNGFSLMPIIYWPTIEGESEA